MNWLSKLERKFGRFAIPNLMLYIIGLNIVGFVIMIGNPQFFYQYLTLNAQAILQGQIWRIFTFLLTPSSTDLFFLAIFCMFYYSIGQALEYSWGSFRLNLYYFLGVLFHVVAAIIVYLLTGRNFYFSTRYLSLSLLLAYGMEFPEHEILFFFVLPIKMKWLAMIDGAYTLVMIVIGFINGDFGSSLAALISLGNFLIFFFSSRRMSPYRPAQVIRKRNFKKQVRPTMNPRIVRHKCAICGRTENDGENLVFRYCSKCEGDYEYCQDHLYTHKHVTKG
ncbi:hypothetical protein P261_00728 [Lachnospiraceae bacterium TWA4]|nr:hypothetical protein P261_00728 [Lachnospiraceae bacterium TWA4]